MGQPEDAPPALPTARQPPLHFAGRKRELADFAAMFADVRRLGRPPGGLVLVDGVQGVGKTQLVKHFASFGVPSFHDLMCAKAKAIDEQRAKEAGIATRQH